MSKSTVRTRRRRAKHPAFGTDRFRALFELRDRFNRAPRYAEPYSDERLRAGFALYYVLNDFCRMLDTWGSLEAEEIRAGFERLRRDLPRSWDYLAPAPTALDGCPCHGTTLPANTVCMLAALRRPFAVAREEA